MTESPVKDLKGEIRYLETIREIVPDNSQVSNSQLQNGLTSDGCNQVRRELETCIKNLKNIVYNMAGEL